MLLFKDKKHSVVTHVAHTIICPLIANPSNHGQRVLMRRVFATAWNNGWNFIIVQRADGYVAEIDFSVDEFSTSTVHCEQLITQFVKKFGGNEFVEILISELKRVEELNIDVFPSSNTIKPPKIVRADHE